MLLYGNRDVERREIERVVPIPGGDAIQGISFDSFTQGGISCNFATILLHLP